MMWDEQERFARVASRVFIGALILLGVVLGAASLATGMPTFVLGYLLILSFVGAAILGYASFGLVLGGVGLMLIGLVHSVRWGWGWGRFRRQF